MHATTDKLIQYTCFNLYYHLSQTLLQGVLQLAIALSEETEDHIQAATAWALGQIGRHTPEHAKAIAQANVLPRLLELYLAPGSSEDLQSKVTIVLESYTRDLYIFGFFWSLIIF